MVIALAVSISSFSFILVHFVRTIKTMMLVCYKQDEALLCP